MKTKDNGRWKVGMVVIGLLFAVSVLGSKAMAKEVTLGVFGDVTGPIAFTGQQFWKGYSDYFKWVEKYDPIPGITIEILMEDTGYDPKRYLPVLKKFRSLWLSQGWDHIFPPI